jgi:predicted deacylase
MLRTAAAEAGIPALLTEAGDQGLLDERAVELHVRGLQRLLRQAGMVPGGAPQPQTEPVLVRSFVPARAERDGWWEPIISIGEAVRRGDPIGTLSDPFGDDALQVTAPVDGVCLVLTTSPATPCDSALAYFGTRLAGAGGEIH